MNLIFRLLRVLLFSRFRQPVEVLAACRTPFMVVPTDLDVLRHMNNGKYFSIMDVARVDMMIRNGLYTKLNQAGFYPVVVAETMRFKKSLKPFQKFDIETQVIGWDEKAFILTQDFKVNQEVMSSAVVRARFLKKSGGSVMPSEILKLVNHSEPSPALPEWVAAWNRIQS